MKRIVLLLAGLPAIVNAQAVKMHNYVSYYNTDTHIPDSVVYTASPHVKTAHRASGFYGNPNLSADYLHSGYEGIKCHIGKDSVAVPLICVKDIYYGKAHEHYEMPNADTVTRHPFTFYRTL